MISIYLSMITFLCNNKTAMFVAVLLHVINCAQEVAQYINVNECNVFERQQCKMQ